MRVNIDLALVYYLIKFFNPRTILEVGFNQGLTFGAMIEASDKNCRLTAIDINLYVDLYNSLYLNSIHTEEKVIEIIQSESLAFNPEGDYEFINIDTDHLYPHTLHEFEKYIKYISKNGIMMIDDFEWEGVDKSIDKFMQSNHDWVPFLLGDQTVFFHHVSHDSCEFLDNVLDKFSPFCSLFNVNYKNHTVKKVSCLPAITNNNDIFTLICQRYDI